MYLFISQKLGYYRLAIYTSRKDIVKISHEAV